MSAVAPQVVVNQLRLISKAVDRLAGDPASAEAPGTLTAISLLLRELIADGEVPGSKDTIPNELGRLKAMVAATSSAAPAAANAEAAPETDVDGPALAKFINEAIAGEGAVEVVEARTVSRGMSKKTVLVSLRGNKVLPGDIVLRVDRSANNYLGTYVTEEFPILELLWRHGAQIPQPFALEPTGKVIGDTFIIFARATGVPVGGNYVAPPRNPGLVADCAKRLAQIHAIPVSPWPRPEQAQGRAFIDEEIDEHLADWKAVGEESAIMDEAFAWILANRERAYGPDVLTHNDYNFNNMLIENDKVSAVLDWEFAHVGTQAADLGYFYYSAAAVSSWEDFLNAYAEAGGSVPVKEQLDFYILWGQLRLAVMGFQSVKSFEEGKFDDVRFGMSRWHRRNGLLRVAELLDRVKGA